jgi:hypothetical protein
MPTLPETELSDTAKQYFADKGIKLPMNWSDMGENYPGAFTRPELATGANCAETLFHEPTLNKYHTGAARTLAREYEEYIDGICASISSAIDQWMKIASVIAVTVVGPVGTLMPDGVEGPELKPLIMAEAPQATERELKHSDAIATALSESWAAWQQGLSGILNYPGFNGAPMPNVPAPLITLISEAEVQLTPENLTDRMAWYFDDPDALHAKDLFDAVAQAFYTHFQEFKLSTLVTGVTVVAAPPPPAELPEGTEADMEAPLEESEENDTAEESAPEETPLENENGDGSETDSEEMAEEPADDPEAEETEESEDAEAEPEELPPPAPTLAGMVIPTPGNFI